MNLQNLTELIVDLRSPPGGFPKFNFNYNYFVDEDGQTYGDVTAYVACRALRHPNRIPNFLADGGDIFALFLKHTGLSVPDAKRLVYPGELVNSAYDLTLITGEHMAQMVRQLIDTGAVNYGALIGFLKYAADAAEAHAARNSPGVIASRVEHFIDYYGDKTKVW